MSEQLKTIAGNLQSILNDQTRQTRIEIAKFDTKFLIEFDVLMTGVATGKKTQEDVKAWLLKFNHIKAQKEREQNDLNKK